MESRNIEVPKNINGIPIPSPQKPLQEYSYLAHKPIVLEFESNIPTTTAKREVRLIIVSKRLFFILK